MSGWVAGAVVVGSVVSGKLAGDAAKDAAQVQAAASQTGIEEQARQFDITQEQFEPFREAGLSALQEQQALLGMGTPEEAAKAFAAFADSPGQQFLRKQQERALVRNASAIGGLGGGNVRTALQEQAFGRASTDFGNQFNRLAAIRRGGQAATESVAQFGAGTAANISNLQTAGGAARASGILGQAQARGQTIGNLTGFAAQSGIFNPAAVAPSIPGGGVPPGGSFPITGVPR